jgi:spermidine synthase
MRFDAPYELVAPYKRKMMSFLLNNATPRYIVMIGLGGGSLAKFCYRQLPAARITVVESNADVIALRDAFRIPSDDARFQVVHADGAAFVRQLQTHVDVLLVDAFDSSGIARTITAPEFYRSSAKALTPTGTFVVNLSGDSARIARAVKGAHAAFDYPIALVSVASRSNTLLFAFKNRDPASLPEGLEVHAQLLQERLALGFPRFLAKLRHARRV